MVSAEIKRDDIYEAELKTPVIFVLVPARLDYVDKQSNTVKIIM